MSEADPSNEGASMTNTEFELYVGSLYFLDPDGILLEFAAWTRELTPADVRHTPAAARPTATLDSR
jgi:hypothetical protein